MWLLSLFMAKHIAFNSTVNRRRVPFERAGGSPLKNKRILEFLDEFRAEGLGH